MKQPMTATEAMILRNNKNIAETIENPEVKPKVGDTVVVTKKDGTQYIGIIVEMHTRIKNWITKVKKVNDDGTTTVEEVSELVVDAIIIVKDIVISDLFKVIAQWFRNLFRKKAQKASV